MAVPYGYKKDQYAWVEDPDEQRALQLMHRWNEQGMDYLSIAAQLTAMGVSPPKGRRWTENSVKHVLVRHKPGIPPKNVPTYDRERAREQAKTRPVTYF